MIRIKKKNIIGIGIIIVLFTSIFGFLLIYFINQPINYPYKIENAFPNLSFDSPVGIYTPNDGTNRLFVVEQTGKIYVFDNNRSTSEKILFLDLSSNITYYREMGLLGLAFHPNYSLNGRFYVDYNDLSGNTTITQFTVNNTDINKANFSSGSIILVQYQPYSNHNGGQIAFGPDGYLYVAFGDGGSSGDPQNNSQNLQNLLGSIIRIDVDSTQPYAIPPDNPFYNNLDGYREEIWAYGFRNPWRFSFDNESGNLWVGDVGQNDYEEIDIVTNGSNYGWNIMEGKHCYGGGLCDQSNLTLPIYEYPHPIGTSIIGGFVYHGTRLSKLIGEYIYGDLSGIIWSLSYDPINGIVNHLLLKDTSLLISSFGIDSSNEIYLCDLKSGNIYKLVEI